MPIQAVFFDLDEALLDDDSSMREALHNTCISLTESYPEIDPATLESTYLDISNSAWTGFGDVPRASGSAESDGREIRIEVWDRALNRYGISSRDLAKKAASIYSQERINTYRLFPDAVELLPMLHKRIKLGIITNGPTDTQHEKIHVTGLDTYIDLIAVSGDLGFGKPDIRIFNWAAKVMGVSPKDALHVGDSFISDVEGSKQAGMYAAWINRHRKIQATSTCSPDFEIYSLLDLVPLLT